MQEILLADDYEAQCFVLKGLFGEKKKKNTKSQERNFLEGEFTSCSTKF